MSLSGVSQGLAPGRHAMCVEPALIHVGRLKSSKPGPPQPTHLKQSFHLYYLGNILPHTL